MTIMTVNVFAGSRISVAVLASSMSLFLHMSCEKSVGLRTAGDGGMQVAINLHSDDGDKRCT